MKGSTTGGRPPERARLHGLLRSVPVVPLNPAIMRCFARIRGQLRHKGLLIPDPDLLIGATAIEHKLTLVTRSVKDFQRIPELSLYQEGQAR